MNTQDNANETISKETETNYNQINNITKANESTSNNHVFQQSLALGDFKMKVEFEVCQTKEKKYINDIAGIVLTSTEVKEYQEKYSLELTQGILIMTAGRNDSIEFYILNCVNLAKGNYSNYLIGEQCLKGLLVCCIKRIHNRIHGLVGLKNGEIVFIDPLKNSEITRKVFMESMVVDFILEGNYLISVGSYMSIKVFDIEMNKMVEKTKMSEQGTSQNCISLLERTQNNLYLAIGSKSTILRIVQIQFNNKNSPENTNSIVDGDSQIRIKFRQTMNTKHIWNLTIDALKEYCTTTDNSSSNDIKDTFDPFELEPEKRLFKSTLIACGGSFYDSTMKYIVQIFDWRRGQLLRTIFDGHTSWVNSLKFFNHKRGLLMVGSADKNTSVYDFITGECIKRFKNSDLVVMHALRVLELTREENNRIPGLPTDCLDIFLLGTIEEQKLLTRMYF